MAVPDQNPFNVYTANGITTVFPYEFYLINADDLTVSLDGEAVSTGFTVTGIGNVNGGEVTFLTPPANDVTVMLDRVVAPVRLTEYQDNGDLLADTVNLDFDRLWMAIKQSFVSLGVALLRPVFGGPFNAKGYRIANLSDPVNDQDAATKKWTRSQDHALRAKTLRVADVDIPALPNAAQRANKVPAFDSAGNPTVMVPVSGSAADVLVQLASYRGSSLVMPCPDVVTLRALTGLASGQEIQLLGYHSFAPGIGGGRLFVSDDTTSADDGFTCFVTTDGVRLKWSSGQNLTVQMAGAVGDGVHIDEDTAGFQRAADAGVSVLVPKPGDFYGINDSTEWKGIMPANEGTYFYGDGSYPELRLMASRCNIISNFIRDYSAPGQTYGPMDGVRIEGLHFKGNMQNLSDPASSSFPTGDNYSGGVYMCKCKNVEIRDCKFENFYYMGHNLFGVLGQIVEDCTYDNIGPSSAYFPNYAAMGSDAWLSGNVHYNRCTVKNCGGVLRGNMGVNNLQVTVSKNWLVENIVGEDNVSGITIHMGGFDNVTYRNIHLKNGSNSHQIAVSGNGIDHSGRNTPVTNVHYENITLENCMTDTSLVNKAMIYMQASGGRNTIHGITITGGGGGTNCDTIVYGGEYVDGATVAKGTLTCSNWLIDTPSAASYFRAITACTLSLSDFNFRQAITWKHINLVSGCSVDIHDGKLDYASPDTANFITRNWAHGSLRNIQGFKTYSFGLDNVLSGATINHGLVGGTPPVVRGAIFGSSGEYFVRRVHATATTISFYITDRAGNTPTVAVPVSWEARAWYELPI
ncbi:phage tail fiber domain-containing protein [Symbiopectobacterium purcellii]|uniref:phage tail fiber domain-containing protein n=1 Tax=Symbiopectobacterium purcellii TaxID=2871826 RepID=UPI003F863AAB